MDLTFKYQNHVIKYKIMTINIELLTKTLEAVKANPEHWNQEKWHCGTSHCFAGFVELIANDLPLDSHSEELRNDERFHKVFDPAYRFLIRWKTPDNSKRLLGLSEEESSTLFHACNTLSDLEHIVKSLVKKYSKFN